MISQATLGEPFALSGVGLHTGADCRVQVRPAAIDSGLTFVLAGGVRVAALAENVRATSLATVIGTADVTVSTVEHVLSALFGMGVSNAEIHVDGPEIPVADGSAKLFTDAIDAAGVVDQRAPRATMTLSEPFALSSGDRQLRVTPASAFGLHFKADFPAPIGVQIFEGSIDPATYRQEICAARTFTYLREVEGMRARGLARGGSLENALVFDENGPMVPMRWENEVVRHKVLDLLGDLALLGAWPQFDVRAAKSGHQMHCELALALRQGAGTILARGN